MRRLTRRSAMHGTLVLGTMAACAAPATAGAYVTTPATIWTIAGSGFACPAPTGTSPTRPTTRSGSSLPRACFRRSRAMARSA
jgi:hypothetical protein